MVISSHSLYALQLQYVGLNVRSNAIYWSLSQAMVSGTKNDIRDMNTDIS